MNPTPRSITEVLKDVRYRLVINEHCPVYTPPTLWSVVVLHCGTETYWKTVYPTTEDPGAPKTWHAVSPHVQTTTVWR